MNASMPELRVKYDDLEWDDPVVPYGARIRGEKFTGVAYKEDHRRYEEFGYLEGLPHGRFYLFDKIKKELFRENYYCNSIPINKHFTWVGDFLEKHSKVYKDGEIEHATIEDRLGNKLFEYSKLTKTLTEWYNCGNIRSEKKLVTTENLYQYFIEQYWHNSGQWLARFQRDELCEFNTTYLLENSHTLWTEEHEKIFVKFYNHYFLDSNEEGLAFLHKNIDHPEPFFRHQVSRLLGIASNVRSIPYLQKLLTDNTKPKRELTIDWLGHGHGARTEYSISRMAEIAIENISSNAQGCR